MSVVLPFELRRPVSVAVPLRREPDRARRLFFIPVQPRCYRCRLTLDFCDCNWRT